jgi:hypothetical protein
MFGFLKRPRSPVRSASQARRSHRPAVESLEGRLALSGAAAPPTAHAVHVQASGEVRVAKVYTVSRVISFQQTAGSFAASNLARVRGLQFYLTSGGSVGNVFVPNTFYGTVSGRLSAVSGYRNLYQFSATRSYSSGVGYTASYVRVLIQTDNSGHPTSMGFLSRSGSNLAAVVNNSGFGASVSNGYTAVVTLH